VAIRIIPPQRNDKLVDGGDIASQRHGRFFEEITDVVNGLATTVAIPPPVVPPGLQEAIPVVMVAALSTENIYTNIAIGRAATYFLTIYDTVDERHFTVTIVAGIIQSGAVCWTRFARIGDRINTEIVITESAGLFTLVLANNDTNELAVSGITTII